MWIDKQFVCMDSWAKMHIQNLEEKSDKLFKEDG